MRHLLMIGSGLLLIALMTPLVHAQSNAYPTTSTVFNPANFQNLSWRNIGPFRGGRSNAVSGVPGQPQVYYMGSTGGGVWKTTDAGLHWSNVSDGFFKTGSVGAIAVAEADPNVIYVGMGEHAIRGVMTSHGDGVYRSVDGGKSWKHLGLADARHIAAIRVHPKDPNLVYVAVQGAAYGPSATRGVYRSADGGQTWEQLLFVDEQTGVSDLSMDYHNPRILYAGTWDHQRSPWSVRSGGPGSGIYKTVDGGASWTKLAKGLPTAMGKVAVDVSRANPAVVYANIEAAEGGVFRSDDGGESWTQTNKQRLTVARAWYYIEIFADPVDENRVYVLNAPMLKSEDGGKTFETVSNPHSDQHDLWINPDDPENIILGNDGGACITFNGGQSWSTQQNQPTAQFYRVIADDRFPYYVYGGQQDNSTVAIASRTGDQGIDWKDWYPVAGGESAFIAFDPADPQLVYGGSYQGNISVYNHRTQQTKDIMAYPTVGLAEVPRDMKYRFNWNAPIVAAPHDPSIIYHGAQVVLRTQDEGLTWEVISPDLTRNDTTKQGKGGGPYTNEGAGGENYNTLSYLACSPHQPGVIWVGSDDGLVHLTRDDGKNWKNVTPPQLPESLINAIEVSPHDPAKAYLALTRYKFNDFTPMVYKTADYGATWTKIVEGIAKGDFVRVVREDPEVAGLLYAGTETGLYLSYDDGVQWHRFQLDLPVCPINDLTIQDNDLIAATSGRAFWILDDLGAIQQHATLALGDSVRLFRPKPAYKFPGRTGDKSPPEQGMNPLAGVTIDYYLPEQLDTTLRLEILNASGQVIRRYSNQKDPAFKRFAGGPPPPPLLPAKQGVNRFHWDLHRHMLPAVADVFMLGNYRGSPVAPGSYTARLIAPNATLEQSIEVLADPRIKADPADFLAQQQLMQTIERTVIDIHESVIQLRDVQQQIRHLETYLERTEAGEELLDMGKALNEKIDAWQNQLIQPEQKTFQDVINFPNRLNAQLVNLLNRVDTPDPRVTQGARLKLAELQGAWETAKQEMNNILQQDVAAFNALYLKKAIPPVLLPAEVDKP